MPEPDYVLRQGDDGVVITDTLLDADEEPKDIAGAEIRFHAAPIRGGAVKIDAEASNDQEGDGEDGTRGDVSYTFSGTDSDTPGLLLGEWEVTYVGGEVQTFPNSGYLLIRVTPQISSAPEAP